MEKDIYNVDGVASGKITLNSDVFGCRVSRGSIYHAIKAELANRRQGTASTKTRGEVRGSTKKPWRQKGLARARVGTRRSPIWRGGGTIFGAHNRDYSIRIPRKLKQLAYRSVLSMRARDEDGFKVVEDFTIESGKTRDFNTILSKLTTFSSGKTVFVYSKNDPMLKQAGRNLMDFTMLSCERLSVHNLFYCKNMLLTAEAARYLNESLAVKSPSADEVTEN